jgi:hypothetical protein
MISDIPDQYNNIDFKIHVKRVSEGPLASKLSGYFLIDNIKINFKAIAFGRIGGQNVSLKIAEKKYDQIKKMGMDPEIILSLVQKKIIEGEINFDEKNLKAREAME